MPRRRTLGGRCACRSGAADWSGICLVLFSQLLLTPISSAQTPDRVQETLEEIIVTGTRIKRDDFNAPQMTTVFDSEDMEKLGLINVGEVITQIPANISEQQPTNNGGDNRYFAGSTLANLRG